MAAVQGVGINTLPGCAHWRTPRDIVAIRFPCCNVFYACYECHAACADHAPQRWPERLRDSERAILCRACQHEMTIKSYMESQSSCPCCAASFNPGCSKHWPLYFEGD